MSHSLFAQVIVDVPVDGPFDYAVPDTLREKISVGSRVSVVFAGRKVIGFVVGLRDRADVEKVLPVLSVCDTVPLFDAAHLEWTRRLSRYYGCSWGQALVLGLPMSLRKSARGYMNHVGVAPRAYPATGEHGGSPLQTTSSAQRPPHCMLIHDPRQTSQWPLISEKIQNVWSQGKSILILIPEISHFSVWKNILRPLRSSVFIADPASKDADKLQQWLNIRTTPQSIVIGPRSALFAPVQNLGLIIVADDDHDFFKEEQSPFYHVREAVFLRADVSSVDLVFAGRMPSVELWQRAHQEDWDIKSFPSENVGKMQRIDVANFTQNEGVGLTPPLIKAIDQCLSDKQRVVLFWNRKGYHRVTQCSKCGETARCPRCDVTLVYSMERKDLTCGRCGFVQEFKDVCLSCQSPMIHSFGRGGEKLAKDLKKLFKTATIARYEAGIKDFPDADIVMVTQSIIHRPSTEIYGLVALLDYDGEMSYPDLRTPQRVFALLARLRLMAQRVIVQTRNPHDPVLSAAETLDFERFYAYDLDIRRTLKFPPFGHCAEIVVRGEKEETVIAGAQELYEALKKAIARDDVLSEPQPDRRPKLRDKFRRRMILKGSDIESMMETVKIVRREFKRKSLTVTVNVNP